MEKNIKYAEFCTGIGGFRIGIESSLFPTKCVYKNEINDNCEKTYLLNFGDTFDSKNIFDIDPHILPNFDMLCAGFPCQPFSIAGKQQGFDDSRGQIIFKIVEIIKIRKPNIVFLENVANLARHNKGETLKTILDAIIQNGYAVYYKILNAKEFGVPQSRPRLFIIAINEKFSSKSFSFPNNNGRKKILRDIIDTKDMSMPVSARWLEYIDLYTGKKQVNEMSFVPPKTRLKLERISHGCNLNDCVLQMRSSGIRAYSLDEQFPTFAVSISGGGAMIPVLSKYKRHLSVLEMKRLMGFPDSFKFNINRTDQIKQLANAVCPPIITEIFNRIVETYYL